MRNRQYWDSKQQSGGAAAVCMKAEPDLGAPGDWLAAAVNALNEMGCLVSHQCATSPAPLTQERVTAYALALIRVRECASAAGLERLMKACDALAVTVSRLIEDQSCVCHEKCEALRLFVVHAHAMIQMSIDGAKSHAQPRPDIPAVARAGTDYTTARGPASLV